VETEWFTVPIGARNTDIRFEEICSAVEGIRPLPRGGVITFEPGGQIEVSSPPHSSITTACAAVAADLATLREALLEHRCTLLGLGVDPSRPPRRVVDAPRYRAMEAYFDARGPEGRIAMCNTAAVQVNLDAGTGTDVESRWRLVQGLGPTLAAAFANSPAVGDHSGVFRSRRLAAWRAADPSRTSPVPLDATSADAWARYALEAPVMLIRQSPVRFVPMPAAMPFARWMSNGHELGYPTFDDFEYHLTTLFPPVRPRGWLEVRMIDALPEPWWRVPIAVTAALIEDGAAAERAARATVHAVGLWDEACQLGVGHPVLLASAKECFAAAIDALPRLGVDLLTMTTVSDFYELFVAQGRCPGDDWSEAPSPLLARVPESTWG
jgi:glutamate--cysteine ligase